MKRLTKRETKYNENVKCIILKYEEREYLEVCRSEIGIEWGYCCM